MVIKQKQRRGSTNPVRYNDKERRFLQGIMNTFQTGNAAIATLCLYIIMCGASDDMWNLGMAYPLCCLFFIVFGFHAAALLLLERAMDHVDQLDVSKISFIRHLCRDGNPKSVKRAIETVRQITDRLQRTMNTAIAWYAKTQYSIALLLNVCNMSFGIGLLVAFVRAHKAASRPLKCVLALSFLVYAACSYILSKLQSSEAAQLEVYITDEDESVVVERYSEFEGADSSTAVACRVGESGACVATNANDQ